MKKQVIGRVMPESSFVEVVELIQKERQKAFQAVNSTLINRYWQVGVFITRKLETAVWGDGVVEQLAAYVTRKHPDIKGVSRFNLSRMRQFYEAYQNQPIVAPLVQ